jgi:hypothetical protein
MAAVKARKVEESFKSRTTTPLRATHRRTRKAKEPVLRSILYAMCMYAAKLRKKSMLEPTRSSNERPSSTSHALSNTPALMLPQMGEAGRGDAW